MRLCRFAHDGHSRLGIVSGDVVIPVDGFVEMIDLIAAWPTLRPWLEDVERQRLGAFALASAELLAPIARPGKIMAIGLNYADHVAESGMKTPEHQTWFAKATSAVVGPFQPVQLPRVSSSVDYEAELVVVIGGGGRHIPEAGALDAVFGYACGNDVSVRDWQLRTPQWILGKSFDTHAPFGPWITTADEVDPSHLGIRALVNGEVRQSSNTRHLVFDVAAQIAHLSQAMTLEPGDLIYTGTPGGVGMGMKPPRFLAPEDVVRIEIDGLGAIENRFVPE
ncbi:MULTISPECIES: fumarylacetoacetate hydrolase family protein [unclassified Sphingomonas]|uniref:fumarylacetoacetate hydrolase family protein n=1 Tax=unclassified Sphingomonas TaxID=196159 RepID=UPI000929FDD3|nr:MULTISPECIES: fumarylacetoacetate hydrolase family protein [unclassified Sphingomonas]MBN8847967.1 fumarylacetoacetate hydrolase family protein [Sphingomonas sp.]OJV34205.1 MAG: 5-carboxymethyl-2-hydroxymuconate isomerase [Sphingomonas sp. 67-36]